MEYYRERRLRHMLRLVNDNRLTDMGERVAKNLDKMFDGVQVSISDLPFLLPSLLATATDLAARMHEWG